MKDKTPEEIEKLRKKKINMSTKTAKYFKAHRIDGLTKSEAVRKAGISTVKNAYNIEATDTYQALELRYGDKLEQILPMDQVTREHAKNILQDENLNAKNKAIEMYINSTKPEVEKEDNEDDKVIIVLRG